VPTADQSGFVRTVVVGGRRSGWPAFVLLAEAKSIRAVPGGFVVGDRSWYLDWPEDSPHQPVLRTVGDRQLLVVPVTEKTLGKAVVYTLVW
jgi:hypothetical protein